eukprot:318144_1
MNTNHNKDLSNPEWIPVANIPRDIYYGVGAMLNGQEMVFVSERFGNYTDCKSIYKYNVHHNEWKPFIDFPQDLKIQHHTITFHPESNKLYLAGQYNEMLIIDIKDKKFHKVSDKDYSSSFPILLNVNGSIHKIGGNGNAKHLIWNEDNNTFDEIFDFEQEENVGTILAASAIYVPSKDIILIIGGIDESDNKMVGVWKYYLVKKEWQKVKGITFDYYLCPAVLSLDEEYIVFVGGYDKERNKVNIMHVLDIRDDDNYILRKSAIKYPMSGHHKIVRSGGGLKDELLVAGYIKQSFKTLLSLDIINLIQMLYWQETIHWLQRKDIDDIKDQNHFVMNMKSMLVPHQVEKHCG